MPSVNTTTWRFLRACKSASFLRNWHFVCITSFLETSYVMASSCSEDKIYISSVVNGILFLWYCSLYLFLLTLVRGCIMIRYRCTILMCFWSFYLRKLVFCPLVNPLVLVGRCKTILRGYLWRVYLQHLRHEEINWCVQTTTQCSVYVLVCGVEIYTSVKKNVCNAQTEGNTKRIHRNRTAISRHQYLTQLKRWNVAIHLSVWYYIY